VLAVAVLLIATTHAFAHHPLIVGEAWCDDETGEKFITYTSTSWDTSGDPGGWNEQIDVYVNGVFVESGAYNAANNFMFSGTVPAPLNSQPGDVIPLSVIAVADWGNTTPGGQTDGENVTIPEDCEPDLGTGRFTGGGHQIRVDGVRVTRGLTIHCDLLLSNNLEINWNGNHFHMTEHMTTVTCSDDPDIIQAPPEAPLDTLVGIGTGRYNGDYGYTLEFTLVDAGEPGRMDQASFLIYETANPANVILDVPLQLLDGGNLQAHKDQPHGGN